MSVHDSEGDKIAAALTLLFFFGDISRPIYLSSHKCSFNFCCCRRLQSPNDVVLQKILKAKTKKKTTRQIVCHFLL